MHSKLGLIFFTTASLWAAMIPAHAQGPMPPCASQAIDAAEHIAGGDFKDINNVFLGTDDSFVVWQIVLGNRDGSNTKTYQVEASVPDCRIEDVWHTSQPDASGQNPNANCGIAINGHSCI